MKIKNRVRCSVPALLHLHAIALSALFHAHAAAAEYSWQISGGSEQTEYVNFSESTTSSVVASHYFGGVDDATGPYALAAFLDPASHVSAIVSRRTEETSLPLASGGGFFVVGQGLLRAPVKSEELEYAVTGRYLLSPSRWYAGGSFSRLDAPDFPSRLRVSEHSYELIAGKYFGPATTLELTLAREDYDSEDPTLQCILGACILSGLSRREEIADDVKVDVHHVLRGRRLTYSVFGGVGAREVEVTRQRLPFLSSVPGVPGLVLRWPPGGAVIAAAFDPRIYRTNAYSAGAEVFPTVKLGVRLSYGRSDSDFIDDERYDVGTTWFFRPNVGLQFSVSRHRVDGSTADTEGGALHVTGRF